jgi:hypothetical protein
MSDSQKMPHGIIESMSRPLVGWLNTLQSAINTKIDEITSASENNIATFDSSGRLKDSGKAIPAGDVVGTTDSQALSNKTLTTPTIGDFTKANHDHSNVAGGGTIDHGNLTGRSDDDHTQYHNDTRGDARYLYQENTTPFTPDADYEPATKKYVDDKKAATQSDAAEAAGDPTAWSEAVTKTDFNAAVGVINALIDKLQAAGLMT